MNEPAAFDFGRPAVAETRALVMQLTASARQAQRACVQGRLVALDSRRHLALAHRAVRRRPPIMATQAIDRKRLIERAGHLIRLSSLMCEDSTRLRLRAKMRLEDTRRLLHKSRVVMTSG